MRLALLMLLAWVGAAAAGADFNYAAYRSAWLSDAAATFRVDPASDWQIDASLKKFHTVAVWTGKDREIPEGRRRFIEGWAHALYLPPQTPGMFEREIEIRQRSETYWMPIQAALLPALVKEVPPGAETHLYLLLAGSESQVPVFLVNEFNVVRSEDRIGPGTEAQ